MESLYSPGYSAYKFNDRVDVQIRLSEEDKLKMLRMLAKRYDIPVPASANNKRSLCNKLISKFNRGGWKCAIPDDFGFWDIHRYDDNKTVYFDFVFNNPIEGLQKLAKELGFKKNPVKEKWDAFKYFDEIKKFQGK